MTWISVDPSDAVVGCLYLRLPDWPDAGREETRTLDAPAVTDDAPSVTSIVESAADQCESEHRPGYLYEVTGDDSSRVIATFTADGRWSWR